MTDLEMIVTKGLKPLGVIEPIYILSLLLITVGFFLLVMLVEGRVTSNHRYTIILLTVIGAVGGIYTKSEITYIQNYNQNLLMSNIYQAEEELDSYTQEIIESTTTYPLNLVGQATQELMELERTLKKKYMITLKDTERAWLKNNIIPRLEKYEEMKEKE